jgi:rubrerythrin
VDILMVLKKLGDLERDLAGVYEWLSTIFKGDERASEFFRKLGLEELAHWDLVKYQERVVRKTPKEFVGVDIDLSSVNKTLLAISDFRKTRPTIRDAIRFALDRETDVSEHYAAVVMKQSNENFAQMVKGLAATQNDQHYGQLIEFARTYP